MYSEKQPVLTRWAGILAVITLLTIWFLLLAGQVATAGPEPPPEQVSASPAQTLADAYILLEKNEDYYGAASVVVTQVTSLFVDQDEAWSRYQAGELDTIDPPLSVLETIQASPIYSPQLHAFPRAGTYFYSFSTDVPPLDNPLLRAALASAIDRTRLISDVLTGDELPALTFTPPRHVGYVDGYATGIGHPYSPTVALNLLAASGYTGDPPITLMVNTSDYHQSIAEAVRDSWYDTLGISATLEHLPWGDYQDLLRDGSTEERPGVWRYGWISDYPDAHNWHGVLFGALVGPFARYDNPAYNALVEAAAGETNLLTRLDLYEQAETTLVESDTVVVPLWTYMLHRLTRPDLLRTYRSYGAQHVDEWTFSGPPRPIEVAWGMPASVDPALSTQWDYVDQLFLGLTDIDPETGAAVPELATAWDVSSDATVYTFTLRSDVTWTDGNPVTAYDVEYGVLRSLDPATSGGYVWLLFDIQNAQEYNEGQITDPDLVGVEALDGTHVRFTLERPAAYFPVIAGLSPARPQPQWAIDAHGGAWTDPANIVTNGPYKLIHWDQAPYLRIEKWSERAPISGGTLVFSIQYRNDGGVDASNCVITDTMLGGLSYVSDTSGFPHSGSGSGPIVWELGTVPANSSAEFEVTVEVTAAYSETVTNRAQIATDDPNDQGEAWEKESEWQEHVAGPRVGVNYGQDRASGVYSVGHTFWITVTESDGMTAKATASVETSPEGSMHDGGWYDGFVAEGGDWSPYQPDIQPGDWVHYRSDDGYINSVRVGTITGVLDTQEDTVAGTITVPWFASQTLEGLAGAWGFWWESFSLDLDGTGTDNYLVDFSPRDIPSGWSLDVHYHEPDGDYVVNTIQSLDLVLNVNYGHDWVEGEYEPGHTLWLTVTQSDGSTEKATAELQTQQIPWWGDRTGFSTNLGDPWQPGRPDLQAYDYVHGEMDNGYTSTVRLGLITGTLDLENDSITGRIHADWLSGPVDGWCGVWENGGPGDGFQFDPDGGTYFCDFGAMGWDLRAGHQVAIQYSEPDGDTVINMFESPWMRVNMGDDWVGGNYPIGHTFWITVTDGLGTPKGYAMTVSNANDGWSGYGFETRDEDWLGGRPDIEPYDLVYIRSDDGFYRVIEVGDIADDLDVFENTIVGTITADWFDEPLDVRCEVWVQDGPDGIDTTADPHGGSYFCDFDDVGWDLQPGQTVSVRYREPDDGDRIINTFQGPAPDMRVEKWAEGGDEALPGGLAVFTIRYRNEGEAIADPVIITDTLATDMHYVADSSKATSTIFDGNQVIWTLGPVAPGEQRQFQLVVGNTASVDDDLVNRVEIYAEHDYNDWNNDDEAWIHIRGDGAAQAHVNKSAEPNDPVPGGTYLYEIDYSNSGPAATGPVVLTDTLPTGVRWEDWYSEEGYGLWEDSKSTPSRLVLEAPTLPANWGDRILLRVRVMPGVQEGTQLINEVELDIPVGYDSYVHDEVWVGKPRWNSHLSKEFDWGVLVPGGELEYSMHVRNHGNQPTQTWLTDTLPAGTHLVRAWRWDGQQELDLPPESLQGQIAVWDLGQMLPGQWYDLNLQLDIDPSVQPGTVLTNCAEIGIDGQDGWPYDNEACVVDTVRDYGPNLRISKEYEWHWDGGTDYRIEYEIRFENLGSQTLYDVDITDTLPPGTHFEGNWWHNYWSGISFEQVGNQLIWTVEELQPGDRSRINFEVRPDTTPEQGMQFLNLVEAPVAGDVYPDDNYDEVVAGTGPDIYIKKWISGGRPTPGGVVTFTVEFGNQNQWPWDSHGDSLIVDTLPPGMTFLTATYPDDPGQEWLPQITGNELEWTWGSMWNGSWWRFDLGVQIADTVEIDDILVNHIEAWSTMDWDADETNNTDDVSLIIESGLSQIYLPLVVRNY